MEHDQLDLYAFSERNREVKEEETNKKTRFSNGGSVHDHRMMGTTSYNLGHEHKYDTSTDMSPNEKGHTHNYFGMTTVDARHNHQMRGITGPAIYNEDGSHYHEYKGDTSRDGTQPHIHEYIGETRGRK